MAEAYIIDAIRTPIGRKKGSLGAVHPADLGAHPIKALFARTDVDPGAVANWGNVAERFSTARDKTAGLLK